MNKYSFEYRGRQLIVKAQLKGVSQRPFEVSMVLDTGSEYTLIDDYVAGHLGYDPSSIKASTTFYSATGPTKSKAIDLVRFDLFGRKEKHFTVHVHNFPPDAGMAHGLVGVDFLQRLRKMKIHFDTQQIEV